MTKFTGSLPQSRYSVSDLAGGAGGELAHDLAQHAQGGGDQNLKALKLF